jgi:hypothetical protein
MVTQLGLSVMTPVFLCVFAGYYIDTHYGTRLILPLLVLGVLSGGRCGYVMAKNTFHVNEKQEAAEDAERAAEKAKQRPRYQEVSRPKTASRITGRSGGSSAPEDGKKEDAD